MTPTGVKMILPHNLLKNVKYYTAETYCSPASTALFTTSSIKPYSRITLHWKQWWKKPTVIKMNCVRVMSDGEYGHTPDTEFTELNTQMHEYFSKEQSNSQSDSAIVLSLVKPEIKE